MINRNLSESRRAKENSGITLIALVVTVVVLIILATISINAVIGQDGIIQKAKDAKTFHTNAQAEEDTKLKEGANSIAQYYTDSNSAEAITVTVDGKTETITKDNVATYLGKVVKNYKPTVSTVTVGEKTYTVSTQYRLYYVDFEGKYGTPNGVYLKADCTANNYYVPYTDTTSADASNVKIKALNPALYKTGVTSPIASNANMKAVTWLTNTSNWDSLKTGSSLANKVNYVVGAPSLEMMMDSYNTKYRLTGEKPDTRALSENTERVKLFYQYPTTGNTAGSNLGYIVGPSNYRSAVNGYDCSTSNYTVKTDSDVDTMYYPGDNQTYWLASPSANNTYCLVSVNYSAGGIMNFESCSVGDNVLCPLVSLQSSAVLELQ